MKKVKLFSLVTMFLIGMIVFAACGNDNDNAPSTNDTQPPVVNNGTDSAGSSDVIEAGEGLPPMTTENISLSVMSWENYYLQRHLVDAFMERYPNITVELMFHPLYGYNESLLNLASAGQLPDVFWYLGNITVPLENMWLGDISSFWNADPETAYFPASLYSAGLVGDFRMATPSKVLPFAFFLDRTVFERANQPMPSLDWTWSEMIETARRMTIPEEQIFGYYAFTQLHTTGPIVNQDAIGEFGWNGETFDFSGFADAIEIEQEFRRTGVWVPGGPEAREAAFGTYPIWPPSTGQLAMQKDAIWTANYFSTAAFVDRGIDWVIYPMPRGDNARTNNKPAFIDFGGISSVTEHPREAYELLKWMGWGFDGWMARIEAYATLENYLGYPVFPVAPDAVPILQHPELQSAYRVLVPDTPEWHSFLNSVTSPVPLGASYIPGFEAFIQWMHEQDIFGSLYRGEQRPHDIESYITENANRFVAEETARIKQLLERHFR